MVEYKDNLLGEANSFLEVLEQVPMDGSLAAAADEGKIEEVYVPYFEQAADRIVLKLHEQEN